MPLVVSEQTEFLLKAAALLGDGTLFPKGEKRSRNLLGHSVDITTLVNAKQKQKKIIHYQIKLIINSYNIYIFLAEIN